MLRNFIFITFDKINIILNEVLSLNAQESGVVFNYAVNMSILNEVLSLNAQELHPLFDNHETAYSSMKS